MPWPTFWPSPWPANRELQVMLRPDCVDIAPDENGSGRVVGREFMGAFNLYSVEGGVRQPRPRDDLSHRAP